jgi:hypothetical protein
VTVDGESPREPLGPCAWFRLCDREATHTQAHPVLGNVPICDPCQAKYDAT